MTTFRDNASGVDPAVVRKWVEGWTFSRGTSRPVPMPGCLRIEVGLPDQARRFVFPQLDPAAIRTVAEREGEPYTFIKVCAPAEKVAPLLPARWTLTDPGFMMTKALRMHREPPPAPPGYRISLRIEGAVTFVEVFDGDGIEAARGRVALNAPFAIIDRIATAPEHRRRGLGTVVMATLEAKAVAAGAEMGILVATPNGFGLYSTLDWTLYSPYTSAVILPAAA
ncbi:GNAT family N-acetyltransferase [Microvirga puerhi]|uniref:GNAT family N-acetyltransferase n=1 Tax=Microvirga puerhi TaxID=2876078 RepID=A0ABS7VRX5_9HYPH|nr:GNAT family N-acetyltransferase [Microvirga puerhi]MBZ6078313.1 GNAT family N-acetyltransferase [Microvirga puerhi]